MSAASDIAVALTVAGSDSGGGAGIQADLRTFSALGVFGVSAISALTSQNPFEVRRVDAVAPEGVLAQIETVAAAFKIGAVKTGMLFSAETVRVVARSLAKLKAPLVVDPVAVATSGAKLLKPDAVQALKEELLPKAAWITPNIPEAELLLGRSVASEKEMLEAAAECGRRWSCSCVLKAGHFEGDAANSTDIVFHEGSLYLLSTPRLEVKERADHGTGCTFSAALTASLAKGEAWDAALKTAKDFVFASLAGARRVAPEILAMFPQEKGTKASHAKLEPVK